MTLDLEAVDLYLNELEVRYTAEELVELLNLTTRDIISAFYEEILEHRNLLNADRE